VVAAEFRVAVPVGAAADAEAEPLRDAREPLLDGRRVAGMAHFQPVEALFLKLPQLAFRAVIPQMRGDGDGADRVQQLRDVGEARERLFDVRGAPASEVATKRVADAVTLTTLDQRARDVRPLNAIGTRSCCNLATICSPRRRRAARVSRRNASRPTSPRGRKYPSRCSSPQGALTLNSQPGTTRTPRRAPSSAAAATPSVVS